MRIRITDADGIVLNADGHPATSLADRDYFHAARERPLQLVISEPLQGRLIQKWGMILARARAPHGRFRGVVYSSISSDHFTEEFREVRLGAHGAISLRSAGLAVIARYTPDNRAPNASVGASQVSAQLQQALYARRRSAAWLLHLEDRDRRHRAHHGLPAGGRLPAHALHRPRHGGVFRGLASRGGGDRHVRGGCSRPSSWACRGLPTRATSASARDQLALQRLNSEQQALLDN